MSAWQVWIRTLIVLVIGIGFLEMLLPENDLKGFAKLGFGLVLMLAVLQPIVSLLNWNWDESTLTERLLADVGKYSDSEIRGTYSWAQRGEAVRRAGIESIVQRASPQLEQQLEAVMLLQPGVKDSAADISLISDGSGIERVKIVLYSGQGSTDLQRLKRAAARFLGIDPGIVEIVLDEASELPR